ncbi:MAG TPA: YetF domain-containing protein [Azospirillum sp.]|nr:YetF domain-containing protein [Azospirillum sp.]
MEELDALARLLLGSGLETKDINVPQMMLRAVIVYLVTVLMVRVGKKRFMGKTSAFDMILGIILGSIVSRAVTGNAPMLPALASAGTLIAMHWAVSAVACRWHGFGQFFKGGTRVLVRDGAVDRHQMHAAHLTDRDLEEDLRRHGVTRVDQVAEARLERNGDISVIRAKSEPRVVVIRVEQGVQTVRVELG